MLPERARVLENTQGTAPGFETRVGGARVFSFAGVPLEFAHLVRTHLLPLLDSNEAPRPPTQLVFRFFGISESDLAQRMEPIFADLDCVVQYRPAFPENILRAVFSSPLSDAASRALSEKVALAGGRAFYGSGEAGLPQRVVSLLTQRGETLAVAESCTGGLLGSLITDVAGASAAFVGGVISYDNGVKETLLQVPSQDLKEAGAVSEVVAGAMARGAQSSLGATWALSITGIAGPDGGTEDKPVGTVCFGLAGPGTAVAKTRNFPNWGRDRIRRLAAMAALRILHQKLMTTEEKKDISPVNGEA
jgi:nicotinamide-nucleotide amidase